MPPGKSLHQTFTAGLSRRAAACLAVSSALLALMVTPALSSPPGHIRPPSPPVRPQFPPALRNNLDAIRDAVHRADRNDPEKLGKLKETMDRKVRELEQKLTDIEEAFLRSPRGAAAAGKVKASGERKDRILKSELDKLNKAKVAFRAQKDASTPDKQACCVYRPEDIKRMEEEYMNKINDAIDKHKETRRSIVGDGLKKTDSAKYNKFRKMQADLKSLKALRRETGKKLQAAQKTQNDNDQGPLIPDE